MSREAKNPVRTLEKSLELLEVLREQNGGQIYELAEEVDLGKSAIHNHLSTLREHGHVVKRDDEYYLGLKFLQLGGHAQNRDDLYRAANPTVNELARQTGARVFLAVEEHEVGVFLIAQTTNTRSRGLEVHSGQRFELHEEPVGNAILAKLPPERREHIFEARDYDDETIETVREEIKTIREDAETVRDRDYVVGDTTRRGERCVSVPIMTDDGRVLGALGIEASTAQHDDDWFESDLLSQVADGASTIETNIKSMFLRDAWIESSTVRE